MKGQGTQAKLGEIFSVTRSSSGFIAIYNTITASKNRGPRFIEVRLTADYNRYTNVSEVS